MLERERERVAREVMRSLDIEVKRRLAREVEKRFDRET